MEFEAVLLKPFRGDFSLLSIEVFPSFIEVLNSGRKKCTKTSSSWRCQAVVFFFLVQDLILKFEAFHRRNARTTI